MVLLLGALFGCHHGDGTSIDAVVSPAETSVPVDADDLPGCTASRGTCQVPLDCAGGSCPGFEAYVANPPWGAAVVTCTDGGHEVRPTFGECFTVAMFDPDDRYVGLVTEASSACMPGSCDGQSCSTLVEGARRPCTPAPVDTADSGMHTGPPP